jgi:hypothetical protein
MPETMGKVTTGSGSKVYVSTEKKDWKLFGKVTTITPPTMTREAIDATTLNSYGDNDKFKESEPGFIEGGDLPINGYYVNGDEGREAADEAFYGDDPVYIKIDTPERIGKTFIYYGPITSYNQLGEINSTGLIGFSVTIKISKKPEVSTTQAQGGNG